MEREFFTEHPLAAELTLKQSEQRKEMFNLTDKNPDFTSP